MGLFNFGKNKQDTSTQSVSNSTPISTPVPAPQTGILNLKKNDILDLTKTAPQLKNIRVAAGWDVATNGRNYDLDLCAILIGPNGKLVKKHNNVVYYGAKKSTGIFLDGDNLTGEGDGDDENIYVSLDQIPDEVSRIVFNVVIYEAIARKQKFGKVKNAYVRIVDEGAGGIEICRYNLSEDGGDNTAVVFAELYRDADGWKFKAIGNCTKASIRDLKDRY